MSLLLNFLPGKRTVKIVLPGNTGYSCILGSGKQITLPGKKQLDQLETLRRMAVMYGMSAEELEYNRKKSFFSYAFKWQLHVV